MGIVDFINSIWIYKITHIWSIKFLQPISHLFFRRKFHKIFETVPLFITLLNPFICKLSFRTITLSGATIILPHLLCKIAFLVIFAYCIWILPWINTVHFWFLSQGFSIILWKLLIWEFDRHLINCPSFIVITHDSLVFMLGRWFWILSHFWFLLIKDFLCWFDDFASGRFFVNCCCVAVEWVLTT